MRWIEGDTIKLSHANGHSEAFAALEQRFPNAMQWLTGRRASGKLFGSQIGKIIKGEELKEPEEWQVDYDEVQEMVHFIIRNWAEAGIPMRFGWKEWNTIGQALEFCTEKIMYLGEKPKHEVLREEARELLGRLIAEKYVHGEDPFNGEAYGLQDYDWHAIFHACKFTVANMNPENQLMMELKEKLKRITPDLLKRLKNGYLRRYTSYGYDDAKIYKELHEIELLPWESKKEWELNKKTYSELRSYQGETDAKGSLSVLRFVVKKGATITICDEKGEPIRTEVVEEDGHSFRDHDVECPFGADYFVLGKHKGRALVQTEDVEIVESEIGFASIKWEEIEKMRYIYRRFKVAKRPKSDD